MTADALQDLTDDAPRADDNYEPTSPWWLSGTPLEPEHHRLMRRRPVPGMSALPDDPKRPKLHQALANTMLVSCVSETYATTVLAATRELTTDPTAQAVLTSIYSDEVMHARLGWSYLRHAIEVGGQGVIDAAAQMLPIALRGVANVVERERPVGDVTAAVRDHGLMTPSEERVIFSSCVRDVLVPGFEA